MENILKDMASRIKTLREIREITVKEMAEATGVTPDAYLRLESGEADFTFTFIYKCAARLGVETVDLLAGESATLETYCVNRAGGGLPIARRQGFSYNNIAPLFKGKIAEPFVVKAPWIPEEADRPIRLAHHEGQEFDYVLRGTLKVSIDGRIEILHEGDSIYYDSSRPHGMIAWEEDCEFLAVTISSGGVAYDYPDETVEKTVVRQDVALPPLPDDPVAERFIRVTEDHGDPVAVEYVNCDNYNFAYDTVDAIADKSPDRLAMIYLNEDGDEKRFTFGDMKKLSNKAANYFVSLGIGRGDIVMLVMKRHWEFWPVILALHKIGAIPIPATNMLVEKDFEYRFRVTDTKAIVCTSDGDTARQAELGARDAGIPDMIKISAKGRVDGWRWFDGEFGSFSDEFRRVPDLGGDDTMLMLFTSGTTGYPKAAAHSYTYALAHYLTARYWHCADPDGIHFTISDTGWGKALWGKLYGQWLCEGAIFVYDFDRFHADRILPLFKKYNITTFCAPPTMYRFFIKEDLSKYDLSSLKHTTIAGEALNPEVYYKWFEYTGLRLMEGFGQTETTLSIANYAGDIPKPGSMGHPSPLYKVDVIRADGRRAEVGETGEIVIDIKDGKPFGLVKEYYKNEEATREVMRDGLYHTGDTAYRDEDGNYWYVGRVDDLIKSSGYRIGPFEIESVIMELPYVLECAVTGVPDPLRGQVVKASIVLVRGKEGTDELKVEIQNYVKEHTAPYKYPRVVEFLDEMPKTISGKIRRVELRERQ
ncbi:MAG: AMP-binding protein [Clostridia bacterium]|nr:AMP-binding protein [Clostridia bacterium]